MGSTAISAAPILNHRNHLGKLHQGLLHLAFDLNRLRHRNRRQPDNLRG